MIPAFVALLAGALFPLGLAPFGWWPLTLVSIASWFYLLHRHACGAWLGWLYGVGKYAVGASWIYVSINVYGNASPLLAGLLVTLFVAGMALFPLLHGWLFVRLRSGHSMTDALWFATLWGLVEWLLTWLLTGFPWLHAGYAFLGTPLDGIAPVGGVMLVSFAVAGSTAYAVLACVGSRRRLSAALALAPWALGLLLTFATWVTPHSTHTVALVQGNIDQAVKWNPESRLPIIRTYVELSETHWDADLLIWPEGAVTVYEHQAKALLEGLDDRGKATGTALVLGLPGIEQLAHGRMAARNLAVVVGNGSGRYVKRRLVPFGEYVPLESLLRGTIEFFDLPMSRFEAGPWRQPPFLLGGEPDSHRGAMAICYEVVYPNLVRRQAAEADVLLTISNDSWFGASIGPPQHLEMAQMRALENGRWLLRGTNNGITAIVDHHGRVTDRLPQFEAGVLRGSYAVMTGNTLYTRVGDWLLLAVLLGSGLYCLWRSRHPSKVP